MQSCRCGRVIPKAIRKPRSYIKNFAELSCAALPDAAKDKPVEVFLVPGQKRARVGQQGTLARLWARKGTRPSAPKDCRYAGAYIFGAICPARATGAALVMPYANTDTMSAHLAEIGRRVSPGAHAILVLDGAGWHSSRNLAVPANITLLTLPPYSPELNPIENIWQFLRQNHLANRVFESYDSIVAACCDAWNALIATGTRRLHHLASLGAGQCMMPLLLLRRSVSPPPFNLTLAQLVELVAVSFMG